MKLEVICPFGKETVVPLLVPVAEVPHVLKQDVELLFFGGARDRHYASLDVYAFQDGKQWSNNLIYTKMVQG